MTKSPEPISFHARLEEGSSTTMWDYVIGQHHRSYSEEGPPSCSERFFEVVKIIAAIAILIIAAVLVGKTCWLAGNHIFEPLLPKGNRFLLQRSL